jgi:propionyl-CoA carboxylase beta chain
VDEVIRPSETRARVVGALAVLEGKRLPGPRRKHGNIPL